jgi:hypothetical protein
MAPQNIVSIDCPKHLQHPGSTIAGQVLIDLDKAAEEHVEEWVVKQIGVVRSLVHSIYVPFLRGLKSHFMQESIGVELDHQDLCPVFWKGRPPSG